MAYLARSAKSSLRWLHRPATTSSVVSHILKRGTPSCFVQTSSSASQSHTVFDNDNTHTQFTPPISPASPPPTPRTAPTKEHQLNTHISSLTLVQSLRANPLYKESRPHLSMPPPLRQSHFVAGSLAGDGKVTVAPYMWTSKRSGATNRDGKSESNSKVTSIFHIGTHMCGHPGYVHGGLLSVMFDEAFARCISTSFCSGLGMTANLNVDFRKPALPERLYVLSAETVRVEGRKAWVEGRMVLLPEEGEGGEGVVVAEGTALFVEPKFAESITPLYRD